MRRVLLAVLAGGSLLAGVAACDSGSTSGNGPDAAAAPTPTSSPTPDYTEDTRFICGRLEGIYKAELRDLGTAIGKMITYKEEDDSDEAKKAENAAAAELKAVATKLREETRGALDPEFKRAGATSAAKLEASAKDRKYFAKVKTLKDLNATIEDQFTTWLTPVAGYCGAPSPSGSASSADPSASISGEASAPASAAPSASAAE